MKIIIQQDHSEYIADKNSNQMFKLKVAGLIVLFFVGVYNMPIKDDGIKKTETTNISESVDLNNPIIQEARMQIEYYDKRDALHKRFVLVVNKLGYSLSCNTTGINPDYISRFYYDRMYLEQKDYNLILQKTKLLESIK